MTNARRIEVADNATLREVESMLSPACSTLAINMLSLQVSGSKLCCLDASEPQWSLEIADIVLIAEFTTDEGPGVDDYFLVFVTAESGKPFFSQCTFYAEGVDEALEYLRSRFNMPIDLNLCSSTVWASHVLWPRNLAGDDYFKFSEVQASGLGSRIRKAVLGPQLEYAISDQIRTYIGDAVAKRKK